MINAYEQLDLAARLGPVLGFLRALWEVNHALESRSKRMKRRFGVSGPERLAIRIIGELPGISPGQLAEVMHVDPSSLTGMLQRLVHRKLVVRSSDPDDARRAHLRLSHAGDGVDAIREGTVEAAIRSALEALAPRDVATAVVVLGSVSRLLQTEPYPAPPHKAATAPRRSGTRRARSR